MPDHPGGAPLGGTPTDPSILGAESSSRARGGAAQAMSKEQLREFRRTHPSWLRRVVRRLSPRQRH